MDNLGEQPKFEIRPAIEQKPFENPAVQSFFAEWCKINDSITPQMTNRQNWEQRDAKGLLEKKLDGKQTLFLPEDLQLWEMVGVMEAVDHDTYATKPERQNRKKEELMALGKVFKNSGIYIAQRLDSINQGKGIARALAEEFYDYGQSLVNGKKAEINANLKEIVSHNLTPEEVEAVDQFLAGEKLYQSRRKRAETKVTDTVKTADAYESERRVTLAQFFKTSQEAFELKQKTKHEVLRTDTKNLKPWQNDTPIYNAFLAKVEHSIIKAVETPKRELEAAIFRRGLENLVTQMRERGWKHGVNSLFEKLGINLRFEQKKIADLLNIAQLKAELESIRQSEDTNKISLKEQEIANKIQSAVGSFPQYDIANNPAEIVRDQYINCVGASFLGGALMKEAGLNYLFGDIPEHSITVLVTANDRIYWYDMLRGKTFNRSVEWVNDTLSGAFNEELSDEMIAGKKKDGSPLSISDIIAFSHNPKPEGLMFDIKSDKYRKELLPWVRKGQRQYLTLFEAEYGQQIQLLNNTGMALFDLGHYDEAVEAFRQAVATDPKHAFSYNGLGSTFYMLGRYEEAIEAFLKFVDLADNRKDKDRVKRAKRIITGLHHR